MLPSFASARCLTIGCKTVRGDGDGQRIRELWEVLTRRWGILVTLLGVLLLLMATGTVTAAPNRVELPQAFADFAFNPESGDLAAVDAEAGTATLFRSAYFSGDKTALVGPVRVGATPCSIVLKRYRDKTYFAVVCTQDSHLYLFDAGIFTLVKKIAIASAGVSLVSSSTNPEDPFLYYNFASDYDSFAAAVDVRTMVDRGSVIGDSMDCALSASGTLIYRRGHGSPSGLESLQLNSSFAEEKPVFVRLFYEHDDTGPYVPDPFDQYTAAGHTIYSVDLTKRVASLGFTPQCFFMAKPVLVGVTDVDRRYPTDWPRRKDEAVEMKLHAASYNTLSPIGTPVSLPASFSRELKPLPRGMGGNADFKRVDARFRVFAHDKGEQVVCAFDREVFFVPLAEFGLPDEAFLHVKIQAPESFAVGEEYVLRVEKMDPRIEVSLDFKPDGMELKHDGIHWTPDGDQVGPQKVTINIKHKDLQRVQSMVWNVAFPSTRLPRTAQAFAVDESLSAALCWDGPPMEPMGTADMDVDQSRIVVADLVGRRVLAQKTMPFVVRAGAMSNEYCFIVAQGNNTVQVLDRATLERVKTLHADSEIVSLEVLSGKRLVVKEEAHATIYALPSLEREASIDGPAPEGMAGSLGSVIGGMLMDTEGKNPRLIVQPGSFPVLASGNVFASGDPRIHQFSNRIENEPDRNAFPAPFSFDGTRRAGPVTLNELPARVYAESKSQSVNTGGSAYRRESELTISLLDLTSGEVRQRILLARPSSPVEQERRPAPLAICGRGLAVAVLHGDRVYRWTADGINRADFPQPLRFQPEQTAFVIASEGTTELKHQLTGGKPPCEFALMRAVEGIEIDEKTGTITIDSSVLIPEAESLVVKYFANRAMSGLSPAESLRKHCFDTMAEATRLLGRKPKGVLLAIPVALRAVDSESQSAALQYYVFAEFPYARLQEKLQEAVEDPADRRATMNAGRGTMRNRPAKPEEDALNAAEQGDLRAELARLRQKIETLEARIDLLTRELFLSKRESSQDRPKAVQEERE